MIHFKKINPLFFWIIIISLAACGKGSKLPYSIDKGKIEDDFDITVTDKNVTLKRGEMFSLPQIGLEASKKEWKWNSKETEIQYAELKDNKYPAYDITITKKGYKTYFGKLLFFNLSSADKNMALSRSFYQIKIASNFFDEAKGGRIKCVNDAQRPTGKKASKKVLKPTWIIWISDSPI
ncbi:MAG: hypothetical protein ABIR78_13850 [Ferruginibacter sp.]